MPRAIRVLAVIAVLIAAVGAGWWAARATLTPADEQRDTSETTQVSWATASQGTVGRSLPLSTTLRQPALPVADNHLAGVVTAISPGEAADGDIVYVVGDTPVRVVQADAPFWRDLEQGAEGEDVAALQRLLIAAGHFDGDADGTFAAATESAVQAWQRADGREQTGTVTLGELVAVANLPAVVQLGEQITVGSTVGGGEASVLAPTGDREFLLIVNQDQSRLIPAEATVEISYEDYRWQAVIAGSELDDFGSFTFMLTAPDGGDVCGSDCDALPTDAQVTLRSEVVVAPEVTGITVPAVAVRTGADGSAYVVTDTGDVQVRVLGSGQGVVVIEADDIDEGTQVQVTGESAAGGPAPGQPAPDQPAPGDDDADTQGG